MNMFLLRKTTRFLPTRPLIFRRRLCQHRGRIQVPHRPRPQLGQASLCRRPTTSLAALGQLHHFHTQGPLLSTSLRGSQGRNTRTYRSTAPANRAIHLHTTPHTPTQHWRTKVPRLTSMGRIVDLLPHSLARSSPGAAGILPVMGRCRITGRRRCLAMDGPLNRAPGTRQLELGFIFLVLTPLRSNTYPGNDPRYGQ